MKIIREPRYREEFTHAIEHDGVEYVRKEYISGNDFHTINWSLLNDEYESTIHYYSDGWTKDGFLGKDNPVPPQEIKVDTELNSVESISDKWVTDDTDSFYY